MVAVVVKNLMASAGEIRDRDEGSIPGLGRSHRAGNGNPLQYSCPGNPMDKEVWRATMESQSQTRLSTHTYI